MQAYTTVHYINESPCLLPTTIASCAWSRMVHMMARTSYNTKNARSHSQPPLLPALVKGIVFVFNFNCINGTTNGMWSFGSVRFRFMRWEMHPFTGLRRASLYSLIFCITRTSDMNFNKLYISIYTGESQIRFVVETEVWDFHSVINLFVRVKQSLVRLCCALTLKGDSGQSSLLSQFQISSNFLIKTEKIFINAHRNNIIRETYFISAWNYNETIIYILVLLLY